METRNEVMASTDAVKTISESLKETDELPLKQIGDIVEVLGAEVAMGLLAEVARVQAEGGLDVRDGTRRRTDGGVFFSLAKARLPKTDRNRIFRIRPPKPPAAEEAAGSEGSTPKATDGAPSGRNARDAAQRPPPPGGGVAVFARDSGAQGRRRVVEIEVVRHHAKPNPPPVPVTEASAPPVQRPPEERPSAPEARPVRRIVVAVPREEAAPATPDAARERIRGALRGLPPAAQKAVLLDLLGEFGAAASVKEPKAATVTAPDAPGVNREQVLASVTEALGLTSGDLARALYSDDGPGARAKARAALERWRRA
jgi:hypothetical protein